ncbi:glycoside hydrolase family 43 protein [Sedimentisphaera salicampi]|uniref:glycoside hydrolase family 43 protein n=1 Tax=Sedimentisphaera salicampi TaxID=1941349 RepID=UPI000B9BAE6B|nr:glycoside hydrolase family 43 protein [Sedimentisphaera salicampi]OXU15773.1 Beta-xylosidase [Sedimentisphaera salicampi]
MSSKLYFLFCILLAASGLSAEKQKDGLKLEDFHVHDPFILADEKTQTYYLYSTGGKAFSSKDLENWEGPFKFIEIPDDSWANLRHGAWAPEVHIYNGKYYLFVTLHNNDRPVKGKGKPLRPRHMRSTQVLVSDSPKGPFKPMSKVPTLPAGMMTLDGTFFVEDGCPWMVYCHEWVQIFDGTIEAVRLTNDLSDTVGQPELLFRGSDAPWAGAVNKEKGAYVTDGCFLYRTKAGKLLMLWSSWQKNHKYTQGLAESTSGKLKGPWKQKKPLLTNDSGHGMIFKTFDGRLMLAVHRPTMSPDSRARLHEIIDTGDSIKLKD